ncbi:MAG: peptidoglycan DD-metalloendopeptidase family protein [Lachnospiraceae bacterium]|nr:peptidoglycan DD-metalloendopeptidase family protein [Lachnospiraceae bacterium]
MYFKKLCKGFALLLVVCILAAGASPFVSRADEVTDLKQSIADKQEAISEANKLKKQLQSGLTDVKKVISGLEKSKNNLSAYISELDTTLSLAQAKILELNTLITDKEAEIKKTTEELNEAIKTEENQYEAMKNRIRFIYEHGETMYLDLFMSAQSFGDVINKADYIEELTAYDRRMLEKYQATREYVEICKAQLEAEQVVLEEAKADVEAEEKALETLISEKQKEIDAFENDINNREKLLKEYEAEIAAQNAEIKALEDAVAAEKAALASATRRKYDGGMFAWPAPSYTRISDDYGYRIHPILKVKQFHNGVDMAAPGGSPILAAYDGTVTAAAYSSSMGNYIMIDHGDNLYTIYMHASKLYVSKGAEVVKGQKIAAVGTTGRSTGNHLHFSVRLNGNYVSPWDYLSS